MKHLAKTILTAILFVPQFLQFSLAQTVTNRQPVIDMSAPDPTVIRAEDGTFYLYATEDMRNVPIFHSANLVDWKLVGTAFTDNSRPKWLPKGGIWAPDIQRVGGKYHLYYAKSVWGGEWDAGIGVAVSNNPAGPFVDRGYMFTSKQIGIQNCIDPFYIEDGGKKYLFFGSFHGIYGVELTADGLHVKQGAKPREVAGTFMEATYIRRRGGYYYLFGSTGTCCEGARSTYRITIGRSKSLFGPYVDKAGQRLLDNHYNILLDKDDSVLGPGHNAGLITDDTGNDYMFYHGFKASDPDAGRVVWLSRIVWADGWPSMMMEKDSQKNETVPVIKSDNRGVATRSGLYPNDFEANINGKRTHLYTLSNSKGMEVCLTNFGARIVSIMVPDRRGTLRDVVLGYDNVAL